MSTWDVESDYYSGQGVVLIGDRDAATGKPTGLIPVGNVSDLKISIATSVIEHKESSSGQRGIDLRLTTELKATVSITMESFNSENLATVLRGTKTVKAGASVSAETHDAYLGKVVALDYMKVSAVVVKKGITTLTAYTDGMADGDWDYKLNAEAGSLLIATTPDTVGLVDEDEISVAYTYAAQNVVDSLTSAASEKYLRFEGLNTADGNDPVVVEIFRFLTDPLKELALISDGIGQFVLEGSALFDTLQPTGSKYFKAKILS
jgi:hypothetical protein